MTSKKETDAADPLVAFPSEDMVPDDGRSYPSLQPMPELTPELIASMKAEHGRIYRVPITDVEFVVRPLYKADWETVLEMYRQNPNMTDWDISEKIVTLCVLAPEIDYRFGGWTALPAGLTPTLAAAIKAKSGFMVPEMPEASQVLVEPIGPREKKPGPTEEEVSAIKSTCPLPKRLVWVEDDPFVVRAITRQEWRKATEEGEKAGDMDTRDSAVARIVTLWPKHVDWDAKPAGFTETVVNISLSISGFSSNPEITEL